MKNVLDFKMKFVIENETQWKLLTDHLKKRGWEINHQYNCEDAPKYAYANHQWRNYLTGWDRDIKESVQHFERANGTEYNIRWLAKKTPFKTKVTSKKHAKQLSKILKKVGYKLMEEPTVGDYFLGILCMGYTCLTEKYNRLDFPEIDTTWLICPKKKENVQ